MVIKGVSFDIQTGEEQATHSRPKRKGANPGLGGSEGTSQPNPPKQDPH